MKNIENIKYTLAHRKAFRVIEKRLLGHNTFRSLFHDFDKVILYMFFDHEKVHNWHRKHMPHHLITAKTKQDFQQAVIDWECARYTKPDKPLNARDTLYKYYPEYKKYVLPILKEFNL